VICVEEQLPVLQPRFAGIANAVGIGVIEDGSGNRAAPLEGSPSSTEPMSTALPTMRGWPR